MAIKMFTAVAKSVTTAGTRVQLTTADTPVLSVTIQASTANTNGLWVGDSDVAVARGTRVAAGQAFTMSAETTGRHGEEFLLSDIWLDSDANGNTGWISYVKRR